MSLLGEQRHDVCEQFAKWKNDLAGAIWTQALLHSATEPQ